MQKPTKAELLVINLSELHKLTNSGRSVEFLNCEPGVEHYRLLAWISQQFKKATLTEVGTLDGCGALALSFNPKNKVVTWDVRFYEDRANWPKNVEAKLVHDTFMDEVVKSPVIFYDTMHDGILERQFVKDLESRNYKGIVVFDDIYLFECMKDFWNGITQRKEDWTDVGHHSGSGVVFFD
jgi:hypothetical protein